MEGSKITHLNTNARKVLLSRLSILFTLLLVYVLWNIQFKEKSGFIQILMNAGEEPYIDTFLGAKKFQLHHCPKNYYR